MSECINVLLNYGFTDLKYNRIEAFVEGKNIGCKRLLEKMKFKKEGLLREGTSRCGCPGQVLLGDIFGC